MFIARAADAIARIVRRSLGMGKMTDPQSSRNRMRWLT
jgi:hypothetical protein